MRRADPKTAARLRATSLLSQAIRRGVFKPARAFLCADCQRAASVYDHRDYAQPFNVEPVCRACNVRRGPAAGWGAPTLAQLHALYDSRGVGGRRHVCIAAKELAARSAA